jgi:hypothetical protein
VIGNSGSMKCALFWQRMAGRILRGMVLVAIVVVLSGNWFLGSVVGVADVVLGPLLNRTVSSVWRGWRHSRSRTEMLGAGD